MKSTRSWLVFLIRMIDLVTEYEDLEENNTDGEESDSDHGNSDPHVIKEHLNDVKVFKLQTHTHLALTYDRSSCFLHTDCV